MSLSHSSLLTMSQMWCEEIKNWNFSRTFVDVVLSSCKLITSDGELAILFISYWLEFSITNLFYFILFFSTVIRDDSRTRRRALNIESSKRAPWGRTKRTDETRKRAWRPATQVSKPSRVIGKIRNGTNLRQVWFEWVSWEKMLMRWKNWKFSTKKLKNIFYLGNREDHRLDLSVALKSNFMPKETCHKIKNIRRSSFFLALMAFQSNMPKQTFLKFLNAEKFFFDLEKISFSEV